MLRRRSRPFANRINRLFNRRNSNIRMKKQPRLFGRRMLLVHRRGRRANIQGHLTRAALVIHLIILQSFVARLQLMSFLAVDDLFQQKQRRLQRPGGVHVVLVRLLRRRLVGEGATSRRRRGEVLRGGAFPSGTDVHPRGAVRDQAFAFGVVVSVMAAAVGFFQN